MPRRKIKRNVPSLRRRARMPSLSLTMKSSMVKRKRRAARRVERSPLLRRSSPRRRPTRSPLLRRSLLRPPRRRAKALNLMARALSVRPRRP